MALQYGIALKINHHFFKIVNDDFIDILIKYHLRGCFQLILRNERSYNDILHSDLSNSFEINTILCNISRDLSD